MAPTTSAESRRLRTGYGLTETVGMCTVLHPDFFSYGVSGCPVPSMEIKVRRGAPAEIGIYPSTRLTASLTSTFQLKDVPDAGYKSTNKLPQGEILLRGPSR